MIVPFINFSGQCGEAIAFYESIFPVEDKQVMRFQDMPPDPSHPLPPNAENYVLHASMIIAGTRVWCGDSLEGTTPGDMVTLSVPLPTVEEVERAFNKLKEGGKIYMDLAPQFYSPSYGCVADKFGVIWHLLCQEA